MCVFLFLTHFVLDLHQFQQMKLTTGGKNFSTPNRVLWSKLSREDRDHGLENQEVVLISG